MEKRVWAMSIIFILFILLKFLVPSFPVTSLPEFDVYDGQTKFNGENAYRTLEYITEKFKDRRIGTKSNLDCAQWVKNQFGEMGLKVIEEDFSSYGIKINSLGMVSFGDAVWKSLGKNTQEYKGKNIVAVSPGKEEDIILIGAHRDTINTLEGAEDDGSGTAVLIELARILSKEDHRYTYYFVSFDGEEYGLYGSNFLAEKYRNKPIKLAVSLDMLGWKDAEGVAFYPFITADEASDIWSYTLAREVLNREGTPFIQTKYVPYHAEGSLKQYTSGIVPTDTYGFINEGIPGLGVFAARSTDGDRSEKFDKIHTIEDTMKYISVDTLDMTGRFMERYLRSVEVIGFDGLPKDNLYLPKGQGVIAGGWIIGFLVVALILSVLAVKLYYDSLSLRTSLIKIIKGEIPWIICIIVASLISVSYWKLLRIESVRNLSLFILILLWVIIISGLIAIIVRYRNKHCIVGSQGVYVNKLMIFILTIVWSIVIAIVMNPLYVINYTAIPLLIVMLLSYQRWPRRIFGYIVLIPMFFIYHFMSTAVFTFDLPFLEFDKGIDINYLVILVPIFIWAVYYISNPLVLQRK